MNCWAITFGKQKVYLVNLKYDYNFGLSTVILSKQRQTNWGLSTFMSIFTQSYVMCTVKWEICMTDGDLVEFRGIQVVCSYMNMFADLDLGWFVMKVPSFYGTFGTVCWLREDLKLHGPLAHFTVLPLIMLLFLLKVTM